MKTKKQTVLELIGAGQYKDALRIVKNFRIEFSESERRTLTIAYECLAGKDRFYNQIGEDVEYIKGQAIALLLWYESTAKTKTK